MRISQCYEHDADSLAVELLFADEAVDVLFLRDVDAAGDNIDLVAKLLRDLLSIDGSKEIGVDGAGFEYRLLLSTCVGWHEKSVACADK